MATVNFYLKNPNTSPQEQSLIYLYFRFSGSLLKFSTGEKVLPRNWNPINQRAKKSATGANELNNVLNKIGEDIQRLYRQAISNGDLVTPGLLRERLSRELGRTQPDGETKKSLFDCIDLYLRFNSDRLSTNYLKRVKTLKNHLLNFQSHKNFKVSFETIDLNFYDRFCDYLMTDLQQLNNTRGSAIKVLKIFLRWAAKRGLNSNMAFMDEDFKATSHDSDIIYLTEKELMALYEHDLSDNLRLCQIRDSFCFGCFTGLRFSDIARVRKENIKGDTLYLITQKTKDKLVIPLNDYAMEILARNNYIIPTISNQKTNAALKELGQLVGINELTIKTRYRGKEEIQVKKPKFYFLTSHTARRTFVTLSLEKGMRAEMVMAITGHKSFKSFKQYIQITDKIKGIEMKKVWNRNSELRKAV